MRYICLLLCIGMVSGCMATPRPSASLTVIPVLNPHMQTRVFDASSSDVFHASTELLVRQGYIIDHADADGGTLSASAGHDAGAVRMTLLVEPAGVKTRLRAGISLNGRRVLDADVYRRWFLLVRKILFTRKHH